MAVEYSQNGYNGLFSSEVYLGAAVVVWLISAFDATYSVIYQSKLLLQLLPVLFKANCNSHFTNILNDEFSVVSTELLSYCYVVVNLRNMGENKVNAGEFVATFKIPCMGYLHSGKLQDCLRLSFQNSYTEPKAEIAERLPRKPKNKCKASFAKFFLLLFSVLCF